MPDVLANTPSKLLRSVEHIARTRATHFPVETIAPVALTGGAMPTLDAFQAAIDALAVEDDVDLLTAGLQDWKDATLDGIAVQRALAAHARVQADNGRLRIAISSIRPGESA